MKKFWIIVALIVCIAAILGGRIYYQHRIGSVISASGADSVGASAAAAETSGSSGSSLDKQINQLPKSLQKAARSASKNSKQVQLVMVGHDNVQSLALLLQNQLDKTFGELFFKVTALDVGKKNSLSFNQIPANTLFQNLNARPDGIIYTPLLYNDDHQVSSDDTQTVTGLFQEKVKIKYPHAAFFVSLPNYSSNLGYMNSRIDSLKGYVSKEKMASINYLSQWPKGAKRAHLVGLDGHTMSAAGRQIWINYLTRQWGLKK
ncbi:hypothetical protein [Sporolactobacillus vineae]|uniref:hypothetical protein n=1 Tax=Sporolactobacillus vineae TaxID=444463 RepID=UPI000289C246|nr:hypothetical protein [Sporolactobacillus vineae]